MFLEAETSFGLSMLQQLPLNESVVFSPLSIALALSLVHAGSEGNTKSQIASAICKGANDDQLKQHYSFLSNSFANPANGVEVNVANKAFVSKEFPIKDSYLKSIKDSYKAAAESLDFGNGGKSAGVMNDFVKTNTKGKITEIVKADDVTPDTAMFLINALYLKADWAEEFYKSDTKDMDFHVKNEVINKIPFMSDSEIHRDYTSNSEVEVLSLKYKDNAYRFNIFLPKEKFGLEKFVKGLTAAKMQELLKGLKDTYLNIKIPKMKLESEQCLKKLLTKLGVTDMFQDTKANLKGMSDKALYVSKATHKAIIEVDEAGTVAAAVTMVKAVPYSLILNKPEPTIFIADHPFLFALTFNNHPIFMGVFQSK
ncbi:hypothetical protein WR25_05862 isoform A [Diploscapter pachys]|uniref:Serpin domain-containing protein n=1 Tax=Diploscapter pachys TaxID=2018661 RepID=A0A2A2L7C6_9BILA|nr:hypothetical protein WR25_05862 isoform A [Diploscapter pachys]